MKKKIIVMMLVLFTLTSKVYAGDISVYVNNQRVNFNPAPQIKNSVTIVPMRAFFEGLGAAVSWNENTRTVVGTRGNTTVTLQIDSKIAYVNGKAQQLTEAATIINGRTFIPLRFVGEALGEKVVWEPTTKTILVASHEVVNNPTEPHLHPFEAEVIQLVNQERAKAGLAPLTANIEVSKVARIKSEDMLDNKYFSHQSPTYGSPFDLLKRFNITYRAAGENIAAGQTTPKQVVDAWMKSPGHKANILNINFNEIGVGYAKGGSYGHYWTQLFIGTK